MHWHARIPAHRRIPRYLRTVVLIDEEEDWKAVLEAEDAAIRAEGVPTPEVIIPTGETLAQLIESLSHAAAQEANDR